MRIKCPGKKLYHLLDGLNVDKFRELQATSNYGLPEIRERLKVSFPNISDNMLKGLAKAAETDYIHNRSVFLTLKSYGDKLIDMSDVLREHIKHCKPSEGSCRNDYLLWLDQGAKEIIGAQNIPKEFLPKIIMDLDLKTLDLFER